jgi:peptidyl-prolyl cis-trans isomerase D
MGFCACSGTGASCLAGRGAAEACREDTHVMTMLDRMRRHKGWLKWSLGLVVVTFIMLYIPSFLGPKGGGIASNDVVAAVEGRQITVGEFRQLYYQQLQAYRNAYGGNVSDEMLRQMGIDQRLLSQMIDNEAALAEADRLGIRASDAELRERILSMPEFQESGRFIGDARYRQVLQLQNPPMRPAEFEDQLRKSLIIGKLHAALTDWITVSNADVDAEYRRRNDKVKIEIVAFPAEKFREGIAVTDPELASFFEANSEKYRVPEKRRIRHVLIDMQAMEQQTVVAEADVKRYYEDNIDQFSTPEQVRASHILFKTEGKDEAAVRKLADEVLQKARSGADFAALAKQYSEDEGSAQNGGDLGFFGRNAMVPEFEQAAFALQPGQISDLIRTQYGFHIIKVTEKKPAVTQPFDQVKAQIEQQLKLERAQTQASRLADQVSAEIKQASDLEPVAKAHGLPMAESGYFAREEPIAGIGFAPEVNAWAFQLTDSQVSPPIRTSQGFAIITVTGRQDPYLPKLDEVKDKVREDLVLEKAVQAARARAAVLAEAASKDGDLAKAAKAAGLEVKTSDLVARGAALPDVGVNPKVDEAAFSLKPGSVSQPIATSSSAVVIKVLERTEATDAEVAAGREALRQEMLTQRRDRFFAAYMTKAKQQMRIDVNREALQQVVA